MIETNIIFPVVTNSRHRSSPDDCRRCCSGAVWRRRLPSSYSPRSRAWCCCSPSWICPRSGGLKPTLRLNCCTISAPTCRVYPCSSPTPTDCATPSRSRPCPACRSWCPSRNRTRYALLGVNQTGETISEKWPKLGHLLVAGKTGSGKSVFLRSLVYQALAEGAQLLLVDLDGATFPMLANHPALLEPIASTPQAAQDVVARALGECDHRAALYLQMDGYPENLEEFNRLSVRQGGEPLPRLLVVLDEFSALVTTLGGPRSSFANQVAVLGWRGRKFGIHLIFAAQDFTKQVVGRVRDQVSAVVCFRVRSYEAAGAVGCPEAVRIPESRPGLACTDRWGSVQTFYLDKRLFGQSTPQDALDAKEQELAQRSLEEADGKMSIPLLVSWDLTERSARSGPAIIRGVQLKSEKLTANLHLASPLRGQTDPRIGSPRIFGYVLPHH